VPPFNPNRIKYETHFKRVTITDVEAMYRKITPKNDIHIFLPSSENLNRKLGHSLMTELLYGKVLTLKIMTTAV
jgi:hypothetical protein